MTSTFYGDITKAILETAEVRTPEEQRDLILRYKNGEENLSDEILQGYYKQIASCVKNMFRRNIGTLSPDDLFQEGVVTALEALQKYDPFRKDDRADTNYVSFSTYLEKALRNSLNRYVVKQDPVCTSELVKQRSRAIEGYREDRYSKTRRNPSVDEIATALELDRQMIVEAIQCAKRPLFLDAPIEDGSEEVSVTWGDALVANECFTSEVDDRLTCDSIMSKMSSCEKEVICLHHGFDGGESRSLREISDIIGVNREKVRQTYNNAIKNAQKAA